MSVLVTSSAPNQVRRITAEAKESFKTDELIVYVLAVVGVLIVSVVININKSGQGFSACQGWFLATLPSAT